MNLVGGFPGLWLDLPSGSSEAVSHSRVSVWGPRSVVCRDLVFGGLRSAWD